MWCGGGFPCWEMMAHASAVELGIVRGWRRRFTIQPSCRAHAAITSRAVQNARVRCVLSLDLLLTDTVSANGKSNGWSAHLLPKRSKKSKGRPCRWASAEPQFLEILTKIKEKDNNGGRERGGEERVGSERAESAGIWWLVLAGWSWENKRIPPHCASRSGLGRGERGSRCWERVSGVWRRRWVGIVVVGWQKRWAASQMERIIDCPLRLLVVLSGYCCIV